jgi:polar amino acid transport system substrate-binding protein
MRVRTGLRLLPLVSLALLPLAGCAPADDGGSSSEGGSSSSTPEAGGSASTGASESAADDCAVDQLPLLSSGTLTVGTDKPAYEPWFVDDDPTNGKGFESAVTYAVAEQMGFTRDQVSWVTVPFNTSYKPGAKDFDFDVNQISITPAREKVVSFSEGYYSAAQAIIALDDSPVAKATSLADLKGYKLGAQTGTTSLTAISDVIGADEQPAVFEDTNAAKQALLNGQVDAIVADLPTAFYITAAEIKGSTIVGQFQPAPGSEEQFGLLFAKDSPLVPCVDAALDALRSNGQLDQIEQEWLSDEVDVPVLQ